jgi:hypothetical protein
MKKYFAATVHPDDGSNDEGLLYYPVDVVDARIATMQIEIDAVTGQRDETYAKLVEAREQIQRLTFGSNR